MCKSKSFGDIWSNQENSRKCLTNANTNNIRSTVLNQQHRNNNKFIIKAMLLVITSSEFIVMGAEQKRCSFCKKIEKNDQGGNSNIYKIENN